MPRVSPRNRLSETQIRQRCNLVCRGMVARLTTKDIGASVGISGRGVMSFVNRYLSFLELTDLPLKERMEERARRADIYLRTGQRETGRKPFTPYGLRGCSRVIGWEAGEAKLCGAETIRDHCVPCEAKLNYPDLSAADAQAIVQHARKTA